MHMFDYKNFCDRHLDIITFENEDFLRGYAVSHYAITHYSLRCLLTPIQTYYYFIVYYL